MWSDLAGNTRKAYRAIHTLAAAPVPTVAFLQECFRLAGDGKHIKKLLVDLDSDSFVTRETASRELTRMPYRAEPMLRWALQNKPSLELRRRIEPILTEPRFPTAEDLRTLRAIAVLERIGTPEARRIWKNSPAVRIRQKLREAKQALHRLKYR